MINREGREERKEKIFATLALFAVQPLITDYWSLITLSTSSASTLPQ